ncbi:MAG: hypothetical protein ACFE0I_25555 [Elainellaceae cyanobacterium]
MLSDRNGMLTHRNSKIIDYIRMLSHHHSMFLYDNGMLRHHNGMLSDRNLKIIDYIRMLSDRNSMFLYDNGILSD